jgi:hypothetical protein
MKNGAKKGTLVQNVLKLISFTIEAQHLMNHKEDWDTFPGPHSIEITAFLPICLGYHLKLA